MEKKNFTIVIIDDLITKNDPIVVKCEQIYTSVFLLNTPNEGVVKIKELNQSNKVIALVDYMFGTKFKPNGKWILKEIRKFNKIVPVILLTAVENQVTDYYDFIKLKLFDIADKNNYENILNILSDAEDVYPKENDEILAQMQFLMKEKKQKERKTTQTNAHNSFYVDKLSEKSVTDLQKLFSEISIRNYKALSGVTLKNLNKINLIAGVNNSGKTSLLEAVYLLCKQNQFDEFVELQRMRGKFVENVPNSFLKNHTPNAIEIEGIFEDLKVSVKYEKQFIVKDIQSQNHVCSFVTNSFIQNDIIGNTKEENLETIAHLYGDYYNDNENKIITNIQRNICLSRFFSPFANQLRERIQDGHFWSNKLKINKLDDITVYEKVENFIKQKIDNKIKSITLVIPDYSDKDVRILVNHSDFNDVKDTTEFGDGLQRIYSIALQFAAAQNGILLIDELENAIDYKNIGEFAGLIIELALYMNVQVFITSHSKECINAFFEYDTVNSISCFAINKNEVRSFSGMEYDNLIEVLNVDLRKEGGKNNG